MTETETLEQKALREGKVANEALKHVAEALTILERGKLSVAFLDLQDSFRRLSETVNWAEATTHQVIRTRVSR